MIETKGIVANVKSTFPLLLFIEFQKLQQISVLEAQNESTTPSRDFLLGVVRRLNILGVVCPSHVNLKCAPLEARAGTRPAPTTS